MTYKVFQKAVASAEQQKITVNNTDVARNWFTTQSKTLSYATPSSIIKTAPTTSNVPSFIGSMQLFAYDPKTKTELPYYDRFPLIFMVDIQRDGFTGLNMHYLPPAARATLMDALYDIAGSDDSQTLSLSYDLLKSAHQLRLFRPCFKRYLNSHVRSNFATIEKENWNIALFLPLARFEKASATHVHAESIKKVNNGKVL